MKPFRIYKVVAGGLERVRNHNNGFDTIDEAINFIGILKQSRPYWNTVQFVIMEYIGAYNAKIVKLIDT